MAHSRLQVYGAILEQRVVPIFNHADSEVARRVVTAILEGGSRLLEFTNRGPGALQAFADLAHYCRERHPELILGAGSIESAEEAALFVAHGASFVVGPDLDERAALILNRRKIAYLPGCASINEIARAEELGAEIVKLFPGEALGPGYLHAILAPRPWTSVLPTGGVTLKNMRLWFDAGAVAVGLGSDLTRKEWLAAGDFGAISEGVEKALAIAAIRVGKRNGGQAEDGGSLG